MEQQDVIAFFDSCAATWDDELVKNDGIIRQILDHAEVGPGMDVLDVACGTGVLFPFYLERNVASVTGIDISPEMVKVAAGKFAQEPKIQVLCADAEQVTFDRKFDRIVVYNAFPHFIHPKRLIKHLASLLKDGGRLTVAHGARRQVIDQGHQGAASRVSQGLMPADSLKKIFDGNFDVEIMISNSRMYQVSGVKRDPLLHSHGELTHTHSHGNEAHSHTPADNATPLEELLVLMRYLVSHNDAHAQEVADLAKELQLAGKDVAYDEIMDAVSDFDMVNAKLDAILSQLSVEEF